MLITKEMATKMNIHGKKIKMYSLGDKRHLCNPDLMFGKKPDIIVHEFIKWSPSWMDSLMASSLKISYDELTTHYKYTNYKYMCIYRWGRQYIYLNPKAFDWLSRDIYDKIITIINTHHKEMTLDDIISIEKSESEGPTDRGIIFPLIFISTKFLMDHGFTAILKKEFDPEKDQTEKEIELTTFTGNSITVSNATYIIENSMRERYRFCKGTDVSYIKFRMHINDFIHKYLGYSYCIANDQVFEDAMKCIMKSNPDKIEISRIGSYYGDYRIVRGLISVEDAIERLLYTTGGYPKESVPEEILNDDIWGWPDPNIVNTPK